MSTYRERNDLDSDRSRQIRDNYSCEVLRVSAPILDMVLRLDDDEDDELDFHNDFLGHEVAEGEEI